MQAALDEAALCTSLAHRNIVTTYAYDFKQMADKQEAGQLLQVEPDAQAQAQAQDFKLFLVQVGMDFGGFVIHCHVWGTHSCTPALCLA
jgi:hypothetical protein